MKTRFDEVSVDGLCIGPLKSPCEGAFWTSVWKSACKRRLKRSLEEAAVKKPAERRFLTRFRKRPWALGFFKSTFEETV